MKYYKAYRARVPRRIDPYNCGCTDCILSYSVPLDEAHDSEIIAMLDGHIENATGYEPEEFIVRIEIDRPHATTA